MKRALLEELAARSRDREPRVLATDLATGASAVVRPHQSEGIRPDLVAAAESALSRDAAAVHELAGSPWFLRPFNPPPRILVVGAVHIAQALAALGPLVGFEIIVIDPRTAWATSERFPGVRLVTTWPEPALAELAPDPRTAVVALTHDPKLDDPALVRALASDAFYVGALGSRRTHARRMERLRDHGVSAAELERIHAPIGLDLGARTPAEIALAVLAEILAALRNR
ncbi:MAG: XdhC family protein [Gemmatimonadota bacterium]